MGTTLVAVELGTFRAGDGLLRFQKHSLLHCSNSLVEELPLSVYRTPPMIGRGMAGLSDKLMPFVVSGMARKVKRIDCAQIGM